jgi:TadE-like protein
MRRRVRPEAGAALVEFALVWPIALLIVLVTVEAAVWSVEAYAARAASLAGARAGAMAGGTPSAAGEVARRTLSSSLVGVAAAIWCPGGQRPAPPVWVCAVDLGTGVEVDIGGVAPSLVPLVAGGGIPLQAHVILRKETFAP